MSYPVLLGDRNLSFSSIFSLSGDLTLVLLGVLLLVLTPLLTLALVRKLAKSEPAYTKYAEILFGLSLTGPLSLLFLPFVQDEGEIAFWVCFSRMLASPFVLIGMGISRWGARFERAKRLLLYALLTEGITLALVTALLIFLAIIVPTVA